jgi:integrase
VSNIVYQNDVYNSDVKNQYISEIKSSSSIFRIFKAAAPLEEFFGKDLYNFNREELRSLFFVLNPSKINASYQNGALVSGYLEWAIQHGYRKAINPLLSVDREYYKQFVNAGKIYFTEEELENFISKCKNAQDAVIIRLKMEGVGGVANSELINLKIGDVNEEKRELRLMNHEGEIRYLTVSDKCISLCLAAQRQQTYLKKNGAYKKETKATTTKLVENDYILRSSITRTESYQEAEKHLIHRRLKVLSDFFNEPYLTSTNIMYSGMLIMARDIYKETGKLDVVNCSAILTKFGFDDVGEGGELAYYRFKKEFLNVEKVKELYGLD